MEFLPSLRDGIDCKNFVGSAGFWQRFARPCSSSCYLFADLMTVVIFLHSETFLLHTYVWETKLCAMAFPYTHYM